MGIILDSKHLSALIDECIVDLKNGVGSRLSDLALLSHTLAQATDESAYYTIPTFIGRLGNEVTLFHSLVDIPLLEPKVREDFKKTLDTSVKEVCRALKGIKEELCKNEEKRDYRNFLECLAVFEKHCYLLRENRTALVERTRGPPKPRGLGS